MVQAILSLMSVSASPESHVLQEPVHLSVGGILVLAHGVSYCDSPHIHPAVRD